MSEELKIGIAGLGTVGAGVFKILRNNAALIERRVGRKIRVSMVCSRDRSKDRGVDVSSARWAEGTLDLAKHSEVDVVVETIGGAGGVAFDLCKTALENKKSVVTANKALIAEKGIKLAKLAEDNGVSLLFEAAVGGGIPIIKALKEGLAGNNFSRVMGILNGTSNYILSEMYKGKRDFEDVLEEAQKLGYAESDPSFDIDGTDSAHKLAILSSLAYGCALDFDSVYREGIENITQDDIAYARNLGFIIRPLAITSTKSGGIEQRVHPCLVPESSSIALVDGVLGAVLVECDYLGPAFFTGAGAGQGPTASAVVSDIMDIAAGRASLPFGIPVRELAEKDFIDIDQHKGEYYVRFNVKDKPGVLASLTSAFSEENIGVGNVVQKADESTNTAQIALTTHEASESSITKVLKNIGKMEYVVETPHMIRIELS